jgi:hypothetical protein
LRLPENLHARLVAAARQRGTSINQVVVESLESVLATEMHQITDADSLRRAMGDLAADPAILLRGLAKPGVPLLSYAELQERLPHLSPSLSETIIADREDRI